MIKQIFYTTFLVTEKEKNEYVVANSTFDFRVLLICVFAALALSMNYYWADYDFARSVLSDRGAFHLLKKSDLVFANFSSNLNGLFYWVMVLSLFYFLIPVALIYFVFKEQLSDYGLKWKGAFKDYHLYWIMLLVMIPLVFYFSTTQSFQNRYPFLHAIHGKLKTSDLIKWEILYCIQFFTLEFFFRGFILHGLKRRFGFYSVFIMTIPYCMIHFGKPMPETIAAIVAGIVLGTLSLKSRSILLGFLIHVSVGLGMDLAALWQKGYF